MTSRIDKAEPPPLRYSNAGNTALLRLLDRAGVRPGRALDCGCGSGDNARLLRERGWTVTGVTYDPAERSAAAAYCADVVVADLADGLGFAADGGYDLVVLSHILEHLVEPAALLREAARVVGPDGTVLVALPNVLYYRQRAEFLRGRFQYSEIGVLDRTHLRFFTVSSGARLLADHGIEVLARGTDTDVPWARLDRVLPAGSGDGLGRRLTTRWPDLMSWQGTYLGRPSSSR